MTNLQIAEQFDKLASLIEFLDRKDPADPFRVRTYRNIANIIRNYEHNIYDLYKQWKLEKIPWFGKETWAKLLEYLETWHISSYNKLKQNIPEWVLQLMDISGIGPKLAKHLYEDLNIKSVDELEKLLESNPEKLLSLPRMGQKTIEKIKQWLNMYKFTKTRTPLGLVYPYAHELLDYILSFPEIKKWEIAGSLRRMKETIWDIDILVVSKDPTSTMEKFKKFENVEKVLVSGDSKTSVFLKQPHIQVDLRIVENDEYWAALQYFTGSKQHNIHLRTIAKEKWYKISEYGIFKEMTEDEFRRLSEDNASKVNSEQWTLTSKWIVNNKNVCHSCESRNLPNDWELRAENLELRNNKKEDPASSAGWQQLDNSETSSEWQNHLESSLNHKASYIKVGWKKEEDIYHTLWMDWIIPEMRQDIGEIQLAQEHKLPKVIEYDDLKWDLHVHSNWSDGQNTIEEMVQAAINLSYEYIGITDHSPSLAVANGLDKERFFQKLEEIEKLRKKYPQIQILMWTEVDILSDGSLDYDEEVLQNCQIVIASIHRWYTGDQTERYLKALENPYITAIGHPTWRIIWERQMMQVNWEKVFDKAIEKWVCMEINCQPLRLDLLDFLIRKFDKMWWKFLINTDAHSIKCLKQYPVYGIGQARRVGLEAKKVLNTYDWEKIKKSLKIDIK